MTPGRPDRAPTRRQVVTPRHPVLPALVAAAFLALVPAAATTPSDLELAPGNTDPVVFVDHLRRRRRLPGVRRLEGDGGERSTRQVAHSAAPRSRKVTVPGPGSRPAATPAARSPPSGRATSRGYDALTFWARASRAATLDVAGLGNDNTGTSLYEAERSAIPLTTDWTQYVIPIPDPARPAARARALLLRRGPRERRRATRSGSTRSASPTSTPSRTPARPWPRARSTPSPARPSSRQGTRTTFAVNGVDATVVEHSPGYFDFFASSNDTVATATERRHHRRRRRHGDHHCPARHRRRRRRHHRQRARATGRPGPRADLPGRRRHRRSSATRTPNGAGRYLAHRLDRQTVRDRQDHRRRRVKVYTELTYAGIEFTNADHRRHRP